MAYLGNDVDAIFLPSSVNTSTKLRISDGDGSILLGNVTTGAATTDSGVLFDFGTFGGLKGGLFTEVDGKVLSYGINVAQIDSGYDSTRAGGIFRLDSRTVGDPGAGTLLNQHCFVVNGRGENETSNYNALGINFNTGDTYLSPIKGNIGVGTLSPTEKLDVVGTVKAIFFSGTLSGNATTATALQTARQINGTSFDGSANITTANWGTSRNLTIGNTTRSVDGSATYFWSLSDIGVNNSTLTLSASGIATGSQTWTSNQGTNATFTVNVPGTDLGITAGTTAGPIVTSSTGNNATLPTASDTASGVVTTGAQTWAGVKTFNNTITGSISGNAGTATTWQTGRTIALTGDVTGTSVAFNGSANLSFATTLANSGVTAGTYRSVTVDVKGRVTAGTNPTTLADYGITDAVPSSRALTIAGTTNQVTVSLTGAQNLTANRSWTLSLPQDIHTAATPTFGGLTVNGNLYVGSNTDLSTSTKNITVESRGYAGLELLGDTANLSGEPGGAYILLAQDGARLGSGATDVKGMIGIVQGANQDGAGGTYTGTTTNSVYFGHKHNSSLHLGTNSTVHFTINASGNVTSDGTLGIRAAASASVATQIPIFTADPATTTRTLVTRTPAQLREDIGAGTLSAVNLGITAGTTAGPIITNTAGTNATLPTASATASGVVTTEAQTWAGAKTFNSTVTAAALIPTGSSVPTNGVYLPTENSVAISTNGSGRLFVDASGNTGIGIASAESLLHIRKAEITVYDGSATDGQLTAGSSVLIQQAGGANNAVAQLVFQPRAAQPYNRIVASGGSLPFLAVVVNNAERARIRSTGLFEVTGAGTAGTSPAFSINGSAPSNSAVVDSTGRLGLGTSSPEQLLHIRGTNAGAKIQTTDLNSGGILFLSQSNNTGASVEYNGASDPEAFQIKTYTSGTLTSTAMTIKLDGKVGIGTTSPYTPLTIRGTDAQLTFDLNTVVNGSYAGIAWNASTANLSSNAYSVEIRGYRSATGAHGALAFHTRDASDTSQERARIDSSGNLLIGNTTGTDTLSVTGTASVSTSITTTNAYNDGTVSKDTKTDGMVIGGGIDLPGTTTNLHRRSQDFSTGYTASASATLSVDSAAISPDGTAGVGKFVCTDTTTVIRRYFPTTNITTVSGTQYTYSVYVKYLDWTKRVRLTVSQGTTYTNSYGTNFDLLNGVKAIGNGLIDSSMAFVGNGWWRLSITTSANTITSMRANVSLVETLSANANGSAVGVVDAGIYTWGAQITPVPSGQTTALGPYIRTEAAAVTDAAGYLKVAGSQIVSSRKTGWAAPTGTATRTTFATSTVTTQQLAERLKALIDDLTAHGLIGT